MIQTQIGEREGDEEGIKAREMERKFEKKKRILPNTTKQKQKNE